VNSRHHLADVALFAALFAAPFVALLAGCGKPPGHPQRALETPAPDQVMDFTILYSENCAGCHGTEGRGSAAIALADPVYLAIADDASIRKVIDNGVKGTAMPAFAQSAGGMLTDKQIEVIVNGIRSRWSKPGILQGANPPSYLNLAKSPGVPAQGASVFKTYCESCHGPDGRGGPKGSSITDRSFLALVSDQYLRTVIITGRPELGAPDWRGNVPGRPMSEQEITDVVAWLASQRARTTDSASNSAQH
jgi:cytochrome c oxidase cbb3-type subunit III